MLVASVRVVDPKWVIFRGNGQWTPIFYTYHIYASARHCNRKNSYDWFLPSRFKKILLHCYNLFKVHPQGILRNIFSRHQLQNWWESIEEGKEVIGYQLLGISLEQFFLLVSKDQYIASSWFYPRWFKGASGSTLSAQYAIIVFSSFSEIAQSLHAEPRHLLLLFFLYTILSHPSQ